MAEHVWYYVADTMLGSTEHIGPISETDFSDRLRLGKIKLDTLVTSPSRLKGAWYRVDQVPGLRAIFEQGDGERQAEKKREAEKRAAQQLIVSEARASERRASDAANAQYAQQVAQISDCADRGLVVSIRERVQGILTSTELVEYIAVQRKPIVNISPDAIVVTNRRLIFYRPKLLGRFEFQDYQWIDLHNAHLKQNLLGAVFWAQHTSGHIVSMDYLSKSSAQALYRIAQEREEQARIWRHRLQIETAKAGAAQVNVQTNVEAARMPSPPAAVEQVDVVKRLETLKMMADKGLITSADFDARKQAILSEI
ncbi:MAG: PH domain-containing protein [Pirellulaceae bacterium]